MVALVVSGSVVLVFCTRFRSSKYVLLFFCCLGLKSVAGSFQVVSLVLAFSNLCGLRWVLEVF